MGTQSAANTRAQQAELEDIVGDERMATSLRAVNVTELVFGHGPDTGRSETSSLEGVCASGKDRCKFEKL